MTHETIPDTAPNATNDATQNTGMKPETLSDPPAYSYAEQTTIPGTDLPVSNVADTIRKHPRPTSSIENTTTASPTEISGIIGNVLYWYKYPQVQSDDECADRLYEFFQHIKDTGEIPTVEKMCLALGIHRQTAWRWKNGEGCSAERSYMIKKAYDIMAALDAELVSRNKIPQVTYIFRSKNYYEMSDQTQIVVTPNVPFKEGNLSDVNKIVEALPSADETDDT